MPVIEVNHKTLREIAAAIEDYCSIQDKEMNNADSAVGLMLSSGWTGYDAKEYRAKWGGIYAAGSSSLKFRDSIKYFGQSLTYCANEYEKAQTEIYNIAANI